MMAASSETTEPALPQRPSDVCLFLDVDGTVIDIAPRPEDVAVPPTLAENLARIDRLLGGAFALVSGRAIEDLDRLFAPLRFRATGVHGAEMRFSPDAPVTRDDRGALDRSDWERLGQVLAAFPGVFAEDKRFSFAVHYRAAPELGPALEAALRRFIGRRSDLVLMPGHFVYELKRPSHDKGAAINCFLRRPPFAGRKPIFIGDDRTDEAGFAAARAHNGEAYRVGGDHPFVTGSFTTPAAVRAWLARFGNGGNRLE